VVNAGIAALGVDPVPQPFRNSAVFPGRTSRRQTASAFSISFSAGYDPYGHA